MQDALLLLTRLWCEAERTTLQLPTLGRVQTVSPVYKPHNQLTMQSKNSISAALAEV